MRKIIIPFFVFLILGMFVQAQDTYYPSADELKSNLNLWDRLILYNSQFSGELQATYIDSAGNTVSSYDKAKYQCYDKVSASGVTIYHDGSISNTKYFSKDSSNTAKFICKESPFCVLQLYSYVKSGNDAVEGSLLLNKVYKEGASESQIQTSIFAVYSCNEIQRKCDTWKGLTSGTREGTRDDCGVDCNGVKNKGEACFIEKCTDKNNYRSEPRGVCRNACSSNSDCADDQFCWYAAKPQCLTLLCKENEVIKNHECVLKIPELKCKENEEIKNNKCVLKSEELKCCELKEVITLQQASNLGSTIDTMISNMISTPVQYACVFTPLGYIQSCEKWALERFKQNSEKIMVEKDSVSWLKTCSSPYIEVDKSSCSSLPVAEGKTNANFKNINLTPQTSNGKIVGMKNTLNPDFTINDWKKLADSNKFEYVCARSIECIDIANSTVFCDSSYGSDVDALLKSNPALFAGWKDNLFILVNSIFESKEEIRKQMAESDPTGICNSIPKVITPPPTTGGFCQYFTWAPELPPLDKCTSGGVISFIGLLVLIVLFKR